MGYLDVPLPTYPYGKSLYKPYIVGINFLYSPRIPREHNKYQGYTVRGTPNYPLEKKVEQFPLVYIYIYGAVGTNSLRLTRSFLSTNGMRMVETPRVKTAFFAIHEYIK